MMEKKTDVDTRPDVKKNSLIDPADYSAKRAVIFRPEGSRVNLRSGGSWDGNWPTLAASLPLRGVAQQLAQQSELIMCDISTNLMTLSLRLPLETLLASGSVEKLTSSLNDHFTLPVKISTEIGVVRTTANAATIVDRAARQEAAETAIKSDQLVQGFMRVFGATIVPGSVKPINRA